MNLKRHRIFASGVHRNDKDPVWPAERVLGVLAATKAHSPARIPYTYRHPENNLPVLGYADRDSIAAFEDGDRTYLDILPVDFAEGMLPGLKQAGFDKVSVGIGKRGEIVHIGVTDKPAVAGLGAAFEAAEVPACYMDEVDFEAADLGNPATAFEVGWKGHLQSWMSEVSSLLKRMRDREIEENGIDAADKYLPAYMVDFLAAPLPVDQEDAQPTESDMDEKQKIEFERLKAENAELLQREQERQTAAVAAEITGFCDAHADVVVPKIRNQIVAILTDLHGTAPRVFDTDGKTESKTSFELLKDLIAGAKPAVVFEEVATSENAPENELPAGVDAVDVALKAQFEAARG